MALPQDVKEPLGISAGDTISFVRSTPDFPASQGWVLNYSADGESGAYQFASTPSGDDHAVLVAADITALWAPGSYILVGYAVNAALGQRAQVYVNQFVVLPNLQQPVPGPGNLTFNQQMANKLEAVLLRKAGHDVMKSTIEGQTIERMSAKELFEWYFHFKIAAKQDEDAQRAALGLPNRNKVKFRPMVVMQPGSPGLNSFGGGSQP